jgi:hypothetical protein
MQVTIDGQLFDIPADELTGRELKARAGIDPQDVLYRVAGPGQGPQVIDDDRPVRLQPGDRVGRVRPFLAGGGCRCGTEAARARPVG